MCNWRAITPISGRPDPVGTRNRSATLSQTILLIAGTHRAPGEQGVRAHRRAGMSNPGQRIETRGSDGPAPIGVHLSKPDGLRLPIDDLRSSIYYLGAWLVARFSDLSVRKEKT